MFEKMLEIQQKGWQVSDSTYKAVSLFTGCGGMDLGVKWAGFDVQACIEIDPCCCETLRENINRAGSCTKVLEGDIRSVDPDKLMSDLGVAPGEIDLLFGGSPCQSFSQIGKQAALSDERGLLLFEMVRFAKAFQPKAIMMEQVKGLLSAKDHNGVRGGVVDSLLSELEALDYVPKLAVLKAADFGVAQNRQRVFIVATKKPNGYKFPLPTHGDPKDVEITGLLPYATVGDVLRDLPPLAVKINGDEVPDNSHYDVTPQRDRERIHYVPEGECLAKQTQLPVDLRCRLTKKDTTKFLRLNRAKPSNTLRGGEIFYHPTEDRYLTPREYMRIHSYPDDYVLRGPIRGRSGTVKNLDQHRQIGNSVPPMLAKLVAEQIMEVIKCRKSSNS